MKIIERYRQSYLKPVIMVKTVHMENGLAAASATLTPGGSNATQPWNPETDDWTEVGGESQEFNL